MISAEWPERADDLREHWDDLEAPEEARRRFFVADVEGGIGGYASLWRQQEGRARVNLLVARAWRRKGIGSALLTEAERLAAGPRALLHARAMEENAEALAFLAARGFEETNRMVRLRLALEEAVVEPLLPVAVAARGVVLTTLAEERARVPDADERLRLLVAAAATGRADPYSQEPAAPPPGEAYESAQQIIAYYDPRSEEAFFLARAEEHYVGLSFLAQCVESDEVFQGDTAVHPEWRRQGVATALKLRGIQYARAHALRAIRTSTASAGMLALNERLGFRRTGAEVRLVKRL
jgi:GNAT superfamily N-acetyltransferase